MQVILLADLIHMEIGALALIGASLAGSALGGLFGMGNQSMSVGQQKDYLTINIVKILKCGTYRMHIMIHLNRLKGL